MCRDIDAAGFSRIPDIIIRTGSRFKDKIPCICYKTHVSFPKKICVISFFQWGKSIFRGLPFSL
ncbi:hypothetical protein C6A36_00915 [Desulfobacteraceae bacterium SEEP-SAG10]|nr:hypothetical protein C6A36_00915 [Desulfobacteraceae bacterium SEEP-SAG10]